MKSFWFFCSGIAFGLSAHPMTYFEERARIVVSILFILGIACLVVGLASSNVRSRVPKNLVGTAYAVRIGQVVIIHDVHTDENIDALKIDASKVDDEGLLKIPDAISFKLGINYKGNLTVA